MPAPASGPCATVAFDIDAGGIDTSSDKPSKSYRLGNRNKSVSTSSLNTGGRSRANLQKGLKCREILQGFVNLFVTQLLILGLSLAHCYCYMVDLEELSDEELRDMTKWVWATGIPLGMITVMELFILVSAQGGKFYRISSWRRFALPLYHKLQLMVLAGMAGRVGMSSYLLILAITETQFSRQVYTSDRITVNVVLLYRALRAWCICTGVSVDSAEEIRKNRMNAPAKWMEELQKEKAEDDARISVKLQQVADSWHVQMAILLLVLVHSFLYGLTRSYKEFANLYWVTKPSGYCILMAFGFEFFVRALAQGGEQFFEPDLHKGEVFFFVLGTFMIGYSTWYHNAIIESRSSFEPAGSATAAVLGVHRFFRFVGIRYQVSASKWDTHSLLGAKAIKMFMTKYGDMIEVPPQNVRVKLLAQGEVEVRVQKARMKPEAFDGLHLPFVPRGALLEDLRIYRHAKRAADGSKVEVEEKKTGQEKSRTKRRDNTVYGMTAQLLKPSNHEIISGITLKNMLVIVGPGDGLAAAGGVDSDSEYWTYENVLQAKSKLIDLVSKRLPVPKNAGSKDTREDDDVGEKPVNDTKIWHLGKAAKLLLRQLKRVQQLLKEGILRNVEININNVTLQYEDDLGRLGRGNVAVGIRVGKIFWKRLQGELVLCDLSRLGVFIETRTANGSSGRRLSQQSVESEVSAHRSSRRSSAFGTRETGTSRISQFKLFASHAASNFIAAIRHQSSSASDTGRRPSTASESSVSAPTHYPSTDAYTFHKADSTEVASQPKAQKRNNFYEPWKTRLGRLLEYGPIAIVRELERFNTAERFRLWALHDLEREFWQTDRLRHLRTERWPEHRMVCSVLRVQVIARPRMASAGSPCPFGDSKSPGSEAPLDQASSDPAKISNSGFSRRFSFLWKAKTADLSTVQSDLKWRWTVDGTPLKISVDLEQIRILQTIMLCLKAWSIHDSSFKWRPDRVDLPSDDSGCPEVGVTRGTIVRLWWLYALHRVLAHQVTRPRLRMIEFIWTMTTKRSYSALLSDIACRSAANRRINPRKWQWQAWELRWKHELEVRLSVPTIIKCYRAALNVAARQRAKIKINGSLGTLSEEDAGNSSSVWKPLQSNKISATRAATSMLHGLKGAGGRFNSLRGSAKDRKQLCGRASATGDDMRSKAAEKGVKDTSRRSRAGSGVRSVQEDSSLSVDVGEDEESEEDQCGSSEEDDLEDLEYVDLQYSFEEEVSDILEPQPDSMESQKQGQLLKNFVGFWDVNLQGMEIRLLRWTTLPRPVLVHAKLRGITANVHVNHTTVYGTPRGGASREKSSVGSMTPRGGASKEKSSVGSMTPRSASPSKQKAMLSCALAVDFFGVSCPDCQLLRLGGDPRICVVQKLFVLGCPRSPDLIAGSRLGHEVAAAARLACTPASAEPALLEVHLPKMSCVAYEPLVLVLFNVLMPIPAKLEIGQVSGHVIDQRYRCQKFSNVPVSQHLRKWRGGPLHVRSGRQGPLNQAAFVDDRTDNEIRLWRERREVTSRRKRMQSSRTWFERLSCSFAIQPNWNIDLNLGAIYCAQIGLYSTMNMMVEEYTIWPFQGRIGRGYDGCQGKCQANKLAAGVNRFLSGYRPTPFIEIESHENADGSLPPWDDDMWLKEDVGYRENDHPKVVRFWEKRDKSSEMRNYDPEISPHNVLRLPAAASGLGLSGRPSSSASAAPSITPHIFGRRNHECEADVLHTRNGDLWLKEDVPFRERSRPQYSDAWRKEDVGFREAWCYAETLRRVCRPDTAMVKVPVEDDDWEVASEQPVGWLRLGYGSLSRLNTCCSSVKSPLNVRDEVVVDSPYGDIRPGFSGMLQSFKENSPCPAPDAAEKPSIEVAFHVISKTDFQGGWLPRRIEQWFQEVEWKRNRCRSKESVGTVHSWGNKSSI